MKIAPFKLERFFAKYEFAAPYLLCSSDCESITVRELLAYEPGAEAELLAQGLGYTESLGQPALRADITSLYQTIQPDEVLVHTGAEEAIFIFMNVTLAAGDHVIVHTPCYQSLLELPRAIGCQVTAWQSRPEAGWALDLDFLRRNIRPNTKAIIVNCPHNPTGYLMRPETQRQLIELARQHNLLLFSDEVYRGLEYEAADRLPAACDLYENAVSLGVMSKTYGLAGLRIGWVATHHRALYQDMAAFKDYTTICNSAPSEFLAGVALRHKEKLARRNLDIIAHNLTLLDAFFADHAHLFEWQRPRAGAIAFPRLKAETDIETFCLDLVRRQGVLLLPGAHFEVPGNHFRIGFGRKNMPQALNRLQTYLETV